MKIEMNCQRTIQIALNARKHRGDIFAINWLVEAFLDNPTIWLDYFAHTIKKEEDK